MQRNYTRKRDEYTQRLNRDDRRTQAVSARVGSNHWALIEASKADCAASLSATAFALPAAPKCCSLDCDKTEYASAARTSDGWIVPRREGFLSRKMKEGMCIHVNQWSAIVNLGATVSIPINSASEM